jgi:hypothetical protein
MAVQNSSCQFRTSSIAIAGHVWCVLPHNRERLLGLEDKVVQVIKAGDSGDFPAHVQVLRDCRTVKKNPS